ADVPPGGESVHGDIFTVRYVEPQVGGRESPGQGGFAAWPGGQLDRFGPHAEPRREQLPQQRPRDDESAAVRIESEATRSFTPSGPTTYSPKPIALPGPETSWCAGAAAVRVVSDCRTIEWSHDRGCGEYVGAARPRRIRPRVVRTRFGKYSVHCCNAQAGGQKPSASSAVRGSRRTGRPSSDAIGTTPRTAFVRNRLFPAS